MAGVGCGGETLCYITQQNGMPSCFFFSPSIKNEETTTTKSKHLPGVWSQAPLIFLDFTLVHAFPKGIRHAWLHLLKWDLAAV